MYYYYEPNNKQIIQSYFLMKDKIIFNKDENKMIIKNFKNEKMDLIYDIETKKFTYYENKLNELPTEVLEQIYEPYTKDIMKNKVLNIPQPIVKFKATNYIYMNGLTTRRDMFGDISVYNEDDEDIDIDVYEWLIVDYKEPTGYTQITAQRGVIIGNSPLYNARNTNYINGCVAIKKCDGAKCQNSSNKHFSINLSQMGIPLMSSQHIIDKYKCSYIWRQHFEEGDLKIGVDFCGCHWKKKKNEPQYSFEKRKTNEYLENVGYKIKNGYILRK